MKAILCKSPGDETVMSLGEAPVPQLKGGQVRIQVKASGVNRADTVQRQGNYPPPPGESTILGLECSGVILEKAPDAHAFQVGDRVMALLAGGGYAEEVTVDEGLVVPLPRDFTFVQGAAVMEVFITAHHNLFTLGRMDKDNTAIIHAGASGVGTAALQLLRGVASRVFTTVGTKEKAKAAEDYGARPILYHDEDFAAVVKDATGAKGVDIVLDPVGASYLARDLDSLAVGGRLVLIGLMGGRETGIDLGLVLRKRIQLIGSTLRGLALAEKREAVERFRKSCFLRFENGELEPVIDKVFPVADVRDAHKRMEANKNIGKIILSWE